MKATREQQRLERARARIERRNKADVTPLPLDPPKRVWDTALPPDPGPTAAPVVVQPAASTDVKPWQQWAHQQKDQSVLTAFARLVRERPEDMVKFATLVFSDGHAVAGLPNRTRLILARGLLASLNVGLGELQPIEGVGR
jgi:hypothetical protein